MNTGIRRWLEVVMLAMAAVLAMTARLGGEELTAYSHDPGVKVRYDDWMGKLRGSVRISQLSIPGTHDSMALMAPGSPDLPVVRQLTKCQSMDMANQLAAGIRYFDLRLGLNGKSMWVYHGGVFQGVSFDQVLVSLNAFLDAHSGETVILDVSHRGFCYSQTFLGAECTEVEGQPPVQLLDLYWDTVRSQLTNRLGTKLWDSRTAIGGGTNRYNPTLSEVRGKVIVMVAEGDRIHPEDADPYPAAEVVPSYLTSDSFEVTQGFKSEYPDFNFQYGWWEAVKGETGLQAVKRDKLYKASIAHVSSKAVDAPPFFVASGKLTEGTHDSQRPTQYTTWVDGEDKYPDFPRAGCFEFLDPTVFPNPVPHWTSERVCVDTFLLGEHCVDIPYIDRLDPVMARNCFIMNEGLNALVTRGIRSGLWDHVGLLVSDFPGPLLIDAILSLNKPFEKPLVPPRVVLTMYPSPLIGPLLVCFDVTLDQVARGEVVLAMGSGLSKRILARADTSVLAKQWTLCVPNVEPGVHTMYAIYDDTYISAPITFTVESAADHAIVVLQEPLNGQVFEAPETLRIRVASAPGKANAGLIGFEAYVGPVNPLSDTEGKDVFIGMVEDLRLSSEIVWTNPPPGRHSIWMIGYQGETVVANPSITIEVLPRNLPPKVTWDGISGGTVRVASSKVMARATALDPENGVRPVEWIDGGVSLGAAAPGQTMSFDSLIPGDHVLWARAVDERGAVGLSESVALTVFDPNRIPRSSLRFDGINDHVRVEGLKDRMPTDEVTVEFWQKANAAKEQVSFATPDSPSGNRFQVHAPWSDGTVYWDFGNIDAGGRLAYVPPENILGTWQHFAFVASRSGNYMKIYRNGVEEASKIGMTPYTRTGADFVMGAFLEGERVIAGFDGELDEFRIWNRALTAVDIAGTYWHRLAGTEEGLVAYWRMEPSVTGNVIEEIAGAVGKRVHGPQWVESCITTPAGSALLVTPKGIQALAGGPAYPGLEVTNLINDSGLSAKPTLENFQGVKGVAEGTWATLATTGVGNYFTAGLTPPVFQIDLGALYYLTDLVVWGYAGNYNEAAEFLLEFSEDGGAHFGRPVHVGTTRLLGEESERLSFGGIHGATTVRLTLLNNAGGRGFGKGIHGDRVGLGEIKFVGTTARLLQTSAAQQMRGNALAGYPAANLTNGRGLSRLPTLDNLGTVTQGTTGLWVTETETYPRNYFAEGQTEPVFDFSLGDARLLTDLVIWGYGGNNNEATDFRIEFSTDGGASYSGGMVVSTTALLGVNAARLHLLSPRVADHVRLTMINNAGGRGFAGEGPGDRVGLGEIRWAGTDVPTLQEGLSLGIGRSGKGVAVFYCNGVLESAATPDGPWQPVDGASSPHVLSAGEAGGFFRIR